MTSGFEPRRGGGAVATFTGFEADLLRSLASQLVELLRNEVAAPAESDDPLEKLLEACRRFPLKRRNRITFEYVLLDGVNDTPEDARRLVRLLGDIKAKVNLLPLNAAPGIPYERPSDERVNAFAQILADHHITVSVRKSRGRDIRAACGQLIVEGQKRSPGRRLAALME